MDLPKDMNDACISEGGNCEKQTEHWKRSISKNLYAIAYIIGDAIFAYAPRSYELSNVLIYYIEF